MSGIDTVSPNTHLPQKLDKIYGHDSGSSQTPTAAAAATTASAFSASLPRSSARHSCSSSLSSSSSASASTSTSSPSPQTSPRPSPCPSSATQSESKRQRPLLSHSRHSSVSQAELQQTLRQSISIQREQQDIIASLLSAQTVANGSSSADSERSSPTLGPGHVPGKITAEDVADSKNGAREARAAGKDQAQAQGNAQGNLMDQATRVLELINPHDLTDTPEIVGRGTPSPKPSFSVMVTHQGIATNVPMMTRSDATNLPMMTRSDATNLPMIPNDTAKNSPMIPNDTAKNSPMIPKDTAKDLPMMIRNEGSQSIVIRQQVIETDDLSSPNTLSADAREDAEANSLSSGSLDHAAEYTGTDSISRSRSPRNFKGRKRLHLSDDENYDDDDDDGGGECAAATVANPDSAQYLSAKRLSRSHVPLPLRLSRLPSHPTARLHPWLAPIQHHRARSIPVYRPQPRFAPSPRSPRSTKQLYPQHLRHFQLLQQQQQLHRLQHHYQVAAAPSAPGRALAPGMSSNPNIVTDVYLGHVSRPAPLLAQPLLAQREALHSQDTQDISSPTQAIEFETHPLNSPRPIFGQITLLNEATYKFKVRPEIPARISLASAKTSAKTPATTDDDPCTRQTPIEEDQRMEWLAREREKFLKVCGDTWDLHFTEF